MILDLSKPFLDLDDKPFSDGKGGDLLMSKVVAGLIVGKGKENIIKLSDWGRDLWKKGQISIDRQDLGIIKTIVESTEEMNILMKAQVIEIIDSLKESKLESI